MGTGFYKAGVLLQQFLDLSLLKDHLTAQGKKVGHPQPHCFAIESNAISKLSFQHSVNNVLF